MQFSTLALLASTAAAMPTLVTRDRPTEENVTITNAAYVGVNGYPIAQFTVEPAGVRCIAEKYTVPSYGWACADPNYQFDIFNNEGSNFTLHHQNNGADYSANIRTRLNGPIPTLLNQIGTTPATLVLHI